MVNRRLGFEVAPQKPVDLISGVNKDKMEPEYDVCFGGRRQFCRSHYADLGKKV